MADLNSECEQKTFDYEQRQIVRTGEIEAIGKAIEIMSSPEVASGAAHTMLMQQILFGTRPAGVSLAQLQSTDQSSNFFWYQKCFVPKMFCTKIFYQNVLV